MTPLDLVLDRLEKVKKHQGYWIARCPAHPDNSPSLSIREARDGKVLLKCHGGCRIEDILRECNLTLADLFADSRERSVRFPPHPPKPPRASGATLRQALRRRTNGLKGRPGGLTSSDRAELVWNLGGAR